MTDPLFAAVLHQALLVGIAVLAVCFAVIVVVLGLGYALGKASGDHDDAHGRPRR